MNHIKFGFLLYLITMITGTSFAQKQTFDIVSYSAPAGWQQQQNEGGVQLSVSDKNTGGYFIAIITKSISSTSSANENFNTNWESLVKTAVQVNGEPTMQEPAKDNGWDIVSGGANYSDGDNTGMATLLTATGGGQTVSVVIMLNSKQYEEDMTAFLNSLELSKAPTGTAKNTNASTSTNTSSNTQKSNSKSSNKSKRCTSCSGGYNLCTLCGGTGRTWQQQQRFNPTTKRYEYTRELAPCTYCGGKGRIRCKVCNGTGFIN